MKRGYLSEYFAGVAAKRLSAVETDTQRSHQHEFNGVEGLKRLFGPATGKHSYPSRFLYLNDYENDPSIAEGTITWYDARERHPTRSEHRLYFPANAVMKEARAGDLLVIGRRPDGSVMLVVAAQGSTVASQVQWLFGTEKLTDAAYAVRDDLNSERDRIATAARIVLEQLGVVLEPPPDAHLDEMLHRFSGSYPNTRDFSAYARSTLPEVDSRADPDAALVQYMEREESLFRTLERHLVGTRLEQGFVRDVDGFVAYSLTVHNRRKSRAGHALENHLVSILSAAGVRFAHAVVTENRSKPDFLFPGAAEYHDSQFPAERLTVLGVKTTCKDRWRQVLAEADRLPHKHLLTLEPAISTAQTDEMRSRALNLVIPKSLHTTYAPAQRAALMSLSDFVDLVGSRQNAFP
jgi:hypothetical protein